MNNINLEQLYKIFTNNIAEEDLGKPITMKEFNKFMREFHYKIRSSDNNKNMEYSKDGEGFKLSLDGLKKNQISFMDPLGGTISMEEFTVGVQALSYLKGLNERKNEIERELEQVKPEKTKEDYLVLKVRELFSIVPQYESDYHRAELTKELSAIFAEYAKEVGPISKCDPSLINKLNRELAVKEFSLYGVEIGGVYDKSKHIIGTDLNEKKEITNVLTPGINFRGLRMDSPIVGVSESINMKVLDERIREAKVKYKGYAKNTERYNALLKIFKELNIELEEALKSVNFDAVGISKEELKKYVSGINMPAVEIAGKEKENVTQENGPVKENVDNAISKAGVDKPSVEKQEVKEEHKEDIPNDDRNNKVGELKDFIYTEDDYIKENIRTALRGMSMDNKSPEEAAAILRWKNSLEKKTANDILSVLREKADDDIKAAYEYYSLEPKERREALKGIVEGYNIGSKEIDPVWVNYLNDLAKKGKPLEIESVEEQLDKFVNTKSKSDKTAKLMMLLSDNPDRYKELATKDVGSFLWKTTYLGNFNTNTYETLDKLGELEPNLGYGDVLKNRADVVGYMRELTIEDGHVLSKNQERHLDSLAKVLSDKKLELKDLNKIAENAFNSIASRESLSSNQRKFIEYFEQETRNRKAVELGAVIVDSSSDIAKRSTGGTIHEKAKGSITINNEKDLERASRELLEQRKEEASKINIEAGGNVTIETSQNETKQENTKNVEVESSDIKSNEVVEIKEEKEKQVIAESKAGDNKLVVSAIDKKNMVIKTTEKQVRDRILAIRREKDRLKEQENKISEDVKKDVKSGEIPSVKIDPKTEKKNKEVEKAATRVKENTQKPEIRVPKTASKPKLPENRNEIKDQEDRKNRKPSPVIDLSDM